MWQRFQQNTSLSVNSNDEGVLSTVSLFFVSYNIFANYSISEHDVQPNIAKFSKPTVQLSYHLHVRHTNISVDVSSIRSDHQHLRRHEKIFRESLGRRKKIVSCVTAIRY